MKKKVFLVAFLAAMLQHAISQNIGIGTTSPASKLDVNGDIAFRSADINITTTYNYALDVNTVKMSGYNLKQQTAANFIVAGITAGVSGRIISLYNRSGASMEIYNEDALVSTAANRITTGTGTTFAVFNGGTVTLRYDAATQRWEIIGSHYNSLDYFGGGGGVSYWDLSGSNIYNNNTGNVGIGTSSPFYKLEVIGSQRLSATPITTPGFNGGLTSGGVLKIDNNSNALSLKIDGSIIQAEKANIQTSGTKASDLLLNPYGGNVGINYSTPLAKLFVRKTSNTSSPEGSLAAFGTTYGSYFHYGATEDTYIRGGKDGSKVIINDGSLGNVGIGLISPSCKLSIFSNVVESNNNTQVLQIAGKNPVMFISDGNGTNHGYIKGVTDNAQTPQFPGAGLEIGAVPGTDLFLSANYSPVLTVAQNNSVGIGTTNPDPNYKLSVAGSIRAKEVVVETGWADYVFDEKYLLPSLKSVEQQIKVNKHLPGIPSAATIEKEGLNIGAVQAKMMEKIEELTLYVIELKKEIELLKAKQ